MEELAGMSTFLIILSSISSLFVGILMALLPFITRKSLLFGVRIPESVKSEPVVLKMKRLYAVCILLGTVLVLGLGFVVFVKWPFSALLITLYQPILLIGIQFFLYILFWRKALRLKQEHNWQVPYVAVAQTTGAFADSGWRRVRHLPWAWYIVAIILCVIAIFFSLAIYPSIPDIMVTHWNGQMKPDAWADKSIGSVLMMPLITIGMILLMLGANFTVYFTKLQVSIENPVLSYAQHRMYRTIISHLLGFCTIIMTVMFLSIQLMILNLLIPSAGVLYGGTLFFLILILLPAIIVSIKVGQSGGKLNPVLTEVERKQMAEFSVKPYNKSVDRSDDRYWKLGLFYYNKADPSLLVEDRFGSNGGFNYARTGGKILLAVLGIITILTYVYTTILFFQLMVK